MDVLCMLDGDQAEIILHKYIAAEYHSSCTQQVVVSVGQLPARFVCGAEFVYFHVAKDSIKENCDVRENKQQTLMQ